MNLRAKRGIAAAMTVVVAAAVNVATAMLTQSWTAWWWVAALVLVITGAVAQVWLTLSEHGSERPGGGGRRGEPESGPSVTIAGNVSGIVSTGDDSNNIQIR